MESPIIRQTNVVTLFDIDEKKLTFVNKHTPNNAYDKNTGKNSTKKFNTLAIDSLINSYIKTNFL